MSDETKTSDEIEAGAAKPAEAAPLPPAEELAAQLAACKEQLLRTAAEADNARKRFQRELADAKAYAVTNFARDMVSAGDNLARAMAALTPDMRSGMGDAGRILVDGVEITQRELLAALSRHGVKPIEVGPGATFDPNLHQAAAQIPSEQPAGKVAALLQPGWTLGDRVLRAAVVAVSAGRSANPNGASAPAGSEA